MATNEQTPVAARDARSWRTDLRSPVVIGLAALLGVQLIGAGVLGLGTGRTNPSLAPGNLDTPLFGFAAKTVAEIRISGSGDGNGVDLKRGKDGWVLGGLGDFPAQSDKVEQLLTELAGLKRPLPTATSKDALKRFKVDDEGFERRVVLEDAKGKSVASLIAGDTPGYRRLYGRPADVSAVFELPLALSELSQRQDDWVDRTMLHIKSDAITSLTTADWTLVRKDKLWSLQGADKPLDQDVVKNLVEHVADLSYRGVLGTTDDPAYNQKDPKLELTVRLADGSSHVYRVSQAEDSEDYVLKRDDKPYYFKLSKYDLEGLLGLTPKKFEPQPKAADKGTAPTAQPAPTPETPAASAPEAASAAPADGSERIPTQEETTPTESAEASDDPAAQTEAATRAGQETAADAAPEAGSENAAAEEATPAETPASASTPAEDPAQPQASTPATSATSEEPTEPAPSADDTPAPAEPSSATDATPASADQPASPADEAPSTPASAAPAASSGE